MLTDIGYLALSVVSEWHLVNFYRYCANLTKQYPFCFICMYCVISAPVCREDFSREYHSDELVRWDSYANFHTVSDGM